MGVNWAAGLMRWKPHTGADGRSYSLSHLHPFRFELEFTAHGRYAARTVAIRVGFGLHVFTCDLAHAGPNSEHYGDSRETRAFDQQRYDASLQLEALVRGLETRKCFFAKTKTFSPSSLPARRAVTSTQRQRRKPIGFRVIISNTLLGNPLKEPG